jgi:predicted nucleotidyltransferase
MNNLAHHLLGKNRAALLAALLLRPEQKLHVRELARLTGASPGSMHRELKVLTELGLLTREEIGRQVFYAADRSCPVLDELAGLLRKTVGLVDVVRHALQPFSERIEAVFVYGSIASGTETSHSDVDVMILGDLAFSDAVNALAPTENLLRREVNATVMKVTEFARRRKTRDGFVTAVLKAPRLWVMGDEDEFGKSGTDQAAKHA